MNKHVGRICAVVFLLVCTGLVAFLGIFTEAEPSAIYPNWESASVTAADGSQTEIDPLSAPAEISPDETYRYTLTLPEGRANGTWLVFETAGMEMTVSLDGTELWSSSTRDAGFAAGLSQAQIPLPEGGGETLVMEVRVTGEPGLFPPYPRLTEDPTDQAGAIAYANLYGIPAGASALACALLAGMLLLGVAYGKPDARLLLPIAAAVLLTAHRLALGMGTSFLPQTAVELLGGSMLASSLPAVLLIAWLALHRERRFWHATALLVAWSLIGCVVTVAFVIMFDPNGRTATYLHTLLSQIEAGSFGDTVYWITLWLVLACAALGAWDLASTLIRTQTEARALSIQNRMVMESYHAIEDKLHQTSELQHEVSHRLTALSALADAGNLDELRRMLDTIRADNARAASVRFAKNPVINAIVQDAAARAEEANIEFKATVLAPETLPIPADDLCILLMNMLDNALEGAAKTASGHPFVRLRIQMNQGFLTVSCENSFDGTVNTDARGRLISTKADPSAHGFGMAQMHAVAEAFGSVLDVRWDDVSFTVQTALRLPHE